MVLYGILSKSKGDQPLKDPTLRGKGRGDGVYNGKIGE